MRRGHPQPPALPAGKREQALQVASLLITSGSVDALVIDSIAALVAQAELDAAIGEPHAGVQANLLSQALRKLAGQIARASTAVVATNQLRQRAGTPGAQTYTAGGRALGYYASVRLHLHHPHTVTEHDRVIGTRVRAQVAKNKLAPAWQACELELHADHGLSTEADPARFRPGDRAARPAGRLGRLRDRTAWAGPPGRPPAPARPPRAGQPA